MSEENTQNPSGSPDTSSGSGQEPIIEVVKEASGKINDTVSFDSHQKLLKEKKAVQGRLEESLKLNKLSETDKLQAEGKKDEVINSQKDLISSLENQIKDKDAAYVYSKITAAVKEKALGMGCSNVNTFMKLADLTELSAHVDDEYNVDGQALEHFVVKVKKENENIGLFGKPAPKIIDSNPITVSLDSKQDLSKLTPLQIATIIAERSKDTTVMKPLKS